MCVSSAHGVIDVSDLVHFHLDDKTHIKLNVTNCFSILKLTTDLTPHMLNHNICLHRCILCFFAESASTGGSVSPWF